MTVMVSVIWIYLAFFLGLCCGAIAAWLLLHGANRAEGQMSDKFQAIAAETLRQSHESFLQLAESRLKQSEIAAASLLDKKSGAIDELIKPVKETLAKMDAQFQQIEVSRHGAYAELMKAVSLSNETQQQLRNETGQLLQALRTPNTRGRWGEIQVKRILEMTGMNEHTRDFSSQHHIASEEGNLRPDYVVALPGGHYVIIDSKVPLVSYLDGSQSNDNDLKQAALKQHARQMREHIRSLGNKAYWDQIEGAADFVVLFVPGDHFLAGALDYDPDLIEYGIAHNVVIATPMTLIALLRTVALGWRQENLRDNAQKLGVLGGELYTAVATMAEHIFEMGRKLSGTLESYNKMIGSIERHVLSRARRLRDFGANKEGKELIDAFEPLDERPRNLQMIQPSEKDDAA